MPAVMVVLSIIISAAAGEAPPVREMKTIQAIYVAVPPVIDGLMDEPAWSEAPPTYGFRDKKGTIARDPAYIRFLCDNENLYISTLCYEHEMEFLRAQATPENPQDFWRDDLLEFHVDIQNRPASDTPYARFAINASGTIQIDHAPVPNPERLCNVVASRRSNGFIAEVSMPLRLLGVEKLNTEVRWGLNIRRVRARRRPDGGEDLFWCNSHLPFDDPSNFGRLIVGPTSEVYVWRLNLENPNVGRNNVASVGVRNATDKAVTVSFTAGVGDATLPAPATRTARANRATVLQSHYDVADPTPIQTLTAQLCKDVTGEVLYRVTVPVSVPPPLEVELREPRYDALLFPEPSLLRAVAFLNAPDEDPRQFVVKSEVISLATTETIKMRERPAQPGANGVIYRSKSIPPGPAELRVEITADGAPYARDSVEFVKLTSEGIAALPTYIDQRNRLMVNGKPLFPIGWYGSGNLKHLEELARSPFNCILDYGMNTKSPAEVQAYLDAAEAQGMKVIYCMNDVYPGATYRGKMGDWKGNEDIAQGVVTTWKNHPAIIAWYLNDELPVSKVPDIKSYYRMFRRLDRGHPTLFVHCDRRALQPFRNTADIIGIDSYPIPGDLDALERIVREAGQVAAGQKPVWAVLQSFAWYQYRPAENPNATGDRGRTPTTLELATGRAPNRAEVRCMTYLALIRGSMGILYYSYYDMRVLPEYPSMWEWMTEIGKELKDLSPFLLEGFRRSLTFSTGDAHISGLSMVLGEEACILVANTGRTQQEVSFRLPPGDWVEAKTLFEAHDGFEFTEHTIKDKIAPIGARAYKLFSPAAVAAQAKVSAASEVITATKEVQKPTQESNSTSN